MWVVLFQHFFHCINRIIHCCRVAGTIGDKITVGIKLLSILQVLFWQETLLHKRPCRPCIVRIFFFDAIIQHSNSDGRILHHPFICLFCTYHGWPVQVLPWQALSPVAVFNSSTSSISEEMIQFIAPFCAHMCYQGTGIHTFNANDIICLSGIHRVIHRPVCG